MSVSTRPQGITSQDGIIHINRWENPKSDPCQEQPLDYVKGGLLHQLNHCQVLKKGVMSKVKHNKKSIPLGLFDSEARSTTTPRHFSHSLLVKKVKCPRRVKYLATLSEYQMSVNFQERDHSINVCINRKTILKINLEYDIQV